MKPTIDTLLNELEGEWEAYADWMPKRMAGGKWIKPFDFTRIRAARQALKNYVERRIPTVGEHPQAELVENPRDIRLDPRTEKLIGKVDLAISNFFDCDSAFDEDLAQARIDRAKHALRMRIRELTASSLHGEG